ncbi:hypothetical protein, partial [Staphylococcus capitis]|uniref:hypothetical protein n=1 Tax=Staphylococcus capitis TaxID=29388 RepID=UPI0011A082F8
MNKNGGISVEGRKVGKDRGVGWIVKVVEEGEGCKGGIERVGDIICGYFVRMVVGMGILRFI